MVYEVQKKDIKRLTKKHNVTIDINTENKKKIQPKIVRIEKKEKKDKNKDRRKYKIKEGKEQKSKKERNKN